MEYSSIIGTLILMFTGLTTYKGLVDSKYNDSYIFDVDKILIGKEYHRLISSGFLHANWIHFGFNMIALMGFSLSLEMVMGYPKFLFIYFASLLGGNLLALYIHRNHGSYRALGASGAISGIVLASVILFPEGEISLILLPVGIKSWIFALIFVLVSILGMKSGAGNIGHDAHLGGAITGVFITVALQPAVALQNWWVVLLILVPVILFLMLIIKNPAVLMIDNYWGEGVKNINRFKETKKQKSKEETLNELLDKIRKNGIKSLSKKEKKLLDKLKDKM